MKFSTNKFFILKTILFDPCIALRNIFIVFLKKNHFFFFIPEWCLKINPLIFIFIPLLGSSNFSHVIFILRSEKLKWNVFFFKSFSNSFLTKLGIFSWNFVKSIGFRIYCALSLDQIIPLLFDYRTRKHERNFIRFCHRRFTLRFSALLYATVLRLMTQLMRYGRNSNWSNTYISVRS